MSNHRGCLPLRPIRLEYDFETATSLLEDKHPASTHRDRTIDENAVIMAPSTKIIAALFKQRIDPQWQREAFEVGLAVNGRIDNRPGTVGTESLPMINKDGSLSTYYATANGVMKILDDDDARDGLFGAVRGRGTRPARLSRLTKKHPEWLEQLRNPIELADQLYSKYLPTPYAIQLAEVQGASSLLRLWHTAFSSAYIIRNVRSGYHRDGNLPGVMSVLMPFGQFTGAELVLPRWRIAFALQPGDMLFFDAEEFHGNLPFEGERASLICYCTRGLSK
jgi:hypothetical protein